MAAVLEKTERRARKRGMGSASNVRAPRKTGYRGVVQNGRIVLGEGAQLPDGTDVVVSVSKWPSGSPPAVLAALKKAHRIPEEAADELIRIIKEARLPAQFDDPLSQSK